MRNMSSGSSRHYFVDAHQRVLGIADRGHRAILEQRLAIFVHNASESDHPMADPCNDFRLIVELLRDPLDVVIKRKVPCGRGASHQEDAIDPRGIDLA